MQHCFFETGDEMKTDLETYFKVLYAADPPAWAAPLPTTSTMQAKSPAEADARIRPPLLLPGGRQHRPSKAAVAKAAAIACVGF